MVELLLVYSCWTTGIIILARQRFYKGDLLELALWPLWIAIVPFVLVWRKING